MESFSALADENKLGGIGGRQLSSAQREALEKSTLMLRASQLYMHYWTDNLTCEDPNDQNWQNQAVFFWRAEEPFPKKALPPVFETIQVKNFIFVGDTSAISVEVGQAMPWFGMPGLGEKFACLYNNQYLTIPELNKHGIIIYIEAVELTADNLAILAERQQYFLLINSEITPFKEGSFYLDDKPVGIDVAYSIGGIQIVKKTTLEK